jgi:hypothetical protein
MVVRGRAGVGATVGAAVGADRDPPPTTRYSKTRLTAAMGGLRFSLE